MWLKIPAQFHVAPTHEMPHTQHNFNVLNPVWLCPCFVLAHSGLEGKLSKATAAGGSSGSCDQAPRCIPHLHILPCAPRWDWVIPCIMTTCLEITATPLFGEGEIMKGSIRGVWKEGPHVGPENLWNTEARQSYLVPQMQQFSNKPV